MQVVAEIQTAAGNVVIPMYNDIFAVIAPTALRFYGYDCELIATCDISVGDMDSDEISVTRENQLLVKHELSLWVYSLRGNSVSLRILTPIVRSKSWIEANMQCEPYFVGTTRIGARTRSLAMFYMQSEAGPMCVAADVGLRLDSCPFWCVIRNRIIWFDSELDNLSYFRLCGDADVSMVPLRGATPLENAIVGDSTVVRCDNGDWHVFRHIDESFACHTVHSEDPVAIIGRGWATMGDELHLFGENGLEVPICSETRRILRRNRIIGGVNGRLIALGRHGEVSIIKMK